MIKQFLPFLILISTSFFLSACTAGLNDPEINFEPPVYVEQMPTHEDKKDFVSTGSIFGQGENPLFSDHKAMNVYDIVTVVISENTSSKNTGSKSLNEKNAMALNSPVFGYGGSVKALSSATKSLKDVSSFNSNLVESSGTYSGSGSAVKDASFTTTISARIVKVMQNGNYFISGRREILVDDQKQYIQISGVIRPYDIDQNNRISSAQISDAKILYRSEGDVSRATEEAWGSKAVKAIWPF